MVKNTVQKITAWSYSRYNDYVKCPYLAFLKHVQHLREPDSQWTERGTEVHQSAEQFVRGTVKILPPVLEEFKTQFKELKKNKATVEHEWAFTAKWERCDWFSRDCWLRMKMDVCDSSNPAQIRVIDHKTGKIRNEHVEQRELYAIGAFIIFPGTNEVTAQHWYLDSGKHEGELYVREKDFERLKKKWERKAKPMLADTLFAPKPGPFCKWCHFRAANGGPCKF